MDHVQGVLMYYGVTEYTRTAEEQESTRTSFTYKTNTLTEMTKRLLPHLPNRMFSAVHLPLSRVSESRDFHRACLFSLSNEEGVVWQCGVHSYGAKYKGLWDSKL